MIDSVRKFKKIVDKIPQGHDLYEYSEYLKSEIPVIEESGGSYARNLTNKSKKDVNLAEAESLSEDIIAAARVDLNKKIFEFQKCEKKWNDNYTNVESITSLDNSSSVESSLIEGISFKVRKITSLELLKYLGTGVASLGLSLLIIFSETVLPFPDHEKALAFAQFNDCDSNGCAFGIILLMLILLAYIFICCFFTLTDLTMSSMYEFIPFQTHGVTMVRSSQMLLNLTVRIFR